MPTVSTIRPTDERATAFRAFAALLREGLKGYVDAVWEHDGTANQSAELPSNGRTIRLTPSSAAWERVATGRVQGECIVYAPVDVQIETRQPGDNADNTISLWGRIEAALGLGLIASHRSPILARLRTAGISDFDVIKPAIEAGENAIAIGVIRLDVYLFR